MSRSSWLDGIAGKVLEASTEGYDRARRVWNGMNDKHPGVIIRASTVGDVVATVRHAAETGTTLAVRGGGHSLPGFSTVDDGIVLDLSGIRRVEVDPDRRVALVNGGALWGDVDAATAKYGLATTGGLISTTGVGGLTLGGGIGWLTRYCGLACDNLLAATIVTADGSVRRADDDADPELLWALRGGGGNFGVVTEFEFRLHPVENVEAGLLLFPLHRATEVAAAYRDWARGLPDAFTTMLVGLTAPDLPDLPETIRGRPAVAIAGCHVGDAAAAAADLAAVRAFEPEADLFGRMSYPDAQQMFDAELPAGHRYYFSGAYLDGLPAGVAEVLTEAIGHAPSARCEIDLHHMGGAAGRVPEDATAFSGRHAAHVVNILAGWEDPAGDISHREWVRSTAAALRPFRSGGDYVNFMGDAYAGAGIVDVYGAARHARLRRVKRRLDPRNVFRLNQNIEP